MSYRSGRTRSGARTSPGYVGMTPSLRPSSNIALLGYSGLSQSSPYLSSASSVVSSYSPSYSTYGGTTSGYGGITIPGIASQSVLSSPSLFNSLFQGYNNNNNNSSGSRSCSPSYYYNNNNSNNSSRSSFSPLYPNCSRYPGRSSSFNRRKTYSRSSKSLTSSTASLAGSEGYESGGEKSVRSSRVESTPSVDDEPEEAVADPPPPPPPPKTTENGEIDYKKLYEESMAENERLREKLRHAEEDLAKSKADKNALSHKNSLSELEKRERRAMERKLSEMEEELKQLEQLKCENQRLKDENGALIRVISKLSK